MSHNFQFFLFYDFLSIGSNLFVSSVLQEETHEILVLKSLVCFFLCSQCWGPQTSCHTGFAGFEICLTTAPHGFRVSTGGGWVKHASQVSLDDLKINPQFFSFQFFSFERA